MTSSDLFVPRTTRLIGREKAVQLISDALKEGDTTHILYLTGKGGIGKTRLLEEVPALAEQAGAERLKLAGIVDLYHAANHSAEGIQETIVKSLDEDAQQFAAYREARQKYERLREAGVTGSPLEASRNKLADAFLKGYQELSGQVRIVLRFDTLELIQYETDVVQRLCQVDDTPTLVKNWLTGYLVRLPNTVVLLAGRDRERLLADFNKAFAGEGVRFTHYRVPGLSDSEADAYLDDVIAQRLPDDGLAAALKEKEFRTQIKELATGGDAGTGVRPIRLSLLLDLLGQGEAIEELTPQNIDQQLVNRLQRLPGETGTAIEWLLRARKGLDRELLGYLQPDWSEAQRDTIFERLVKFAFVKTYQGDADTLFAHDDLYDTIDRYNRGDPNHLNAFRPLFEFYREVEPAAKTVTERERLRLARLYYELLLDPRAGYHDCYARWDEEAIFNHDTEFDMRLRDEVLRFLNRYAFNSGTPYHNDAIAGRIDADGVHRDCAVRWVKRHIARNRLREAATIAERLRHEQDPRFFWDNLSGSDTLYKAALLVAWGEALYHQGGMHLADAEARLQDATALLEKRQPAQGEGAEAGNERWWYARILGRAHNNLGYLYWNQGHYARALKHSQTALGKFEQARIESEMANTLNNTAYLLALVGRIRPAMHHVERGLRLREQALVRQPYQLGLSLNTQGLIHTANDHPAWGIRSSEEALKLFEEAHEPRGQGLAHNALGYSWRKLSEQWKRDRTVVPKETRKRYKQARFHLQKARGIFDGQVDEPIRLWEAYNELGSLCIDQAQMVRRRLGKPKHGADLYEEGIEAQQKALQLAQQSDFAVQEVDTLDDLAQAWSDRGFMYAEDFKNPDEAARCWRQAEEYLQQALKRIPQAFRVEAWADSPADSQQGEMYLQLLGKLYLQQGIWNFDGLKYNRVLEGEPVSYDRGIRAFALAAACFERFWKQSHALGNALDAMMARLERRAIPADQARAVVRATAREYQIDLDTMLQRIGDTLGIALY